MLPCPQAKTTVGSYHRTVCIRRNQTRKEIKSTSPDSIFFRFLSLGTQVLPLFPQTSRSSLHKDLPGRAWEEPTASTARMPQNLICKAAKGEWCKPALGVGLERKQGKQWSCTHHGGIKWHFMYRSDDMHWNKKISEGLQLFAGAESPETCHKVYFGEVVVKVHCCSRK